MIKLFFIFLGFGITAFFLAFKLPLKRRIVISLLVFLIPAVVSLIILFSSGDKPPEGAVKYTGQVQHSEENGSSSK